jgi:hypothetical protein
MIVGCEKKHLKNNIFSFKMILTDYVNIMVSGDFSFILLLNKNSKLNQFPAKNGHIQIGTSFVPNSYQSNTSFEHPLYWQILLLIFDTKLCSSDSNLVLMKYSFSTPFQ